MFTKHSIDGSAVCTKRLITGDGFPVSGAQDRHAVNIDELLHRIARLLAELLFARRQLQHARDAIPELLSRIRDLELDEVGLNVGAIHALQTLEGLGALEGTGSKLAREGVILGLSHPSAGVRRNALAVLPKDDHFLSVVFCSGGSSFKSSTTAESSNPLAL